jgi:uncharacterized protein (DUF305 family)
MSQSKTAKIGKQTFTVRELTLREIKSLTEGAGESPIDSLVNLLTISTTAKPEDLSEQAPSDIKEFVDAMLEVNTPFFDMAEAANMKGSADALRQLIRSIFLTSFSHLSKEDTE